MNDNMGKVVEFLLSTGQALPRVKQYDDPLNDCFYVADAPHGSLLTDPVWRVRKVIHKVGGIDNELDEMKETDGYSNRATNLGVVQLLTYH